jgi:hypothetical protein
VEDMSDEFEAGDLDIIEWLEDLGSTLNKGFFRVLKFVDFENHPDYKNREEFFKSTLPSKMFTEFKQSSGFDLGILKSLK